MTDLFVSSSSTMHKAMETVERAVKVEPGEYAEDLTEPKKVEELTPERVKELRLAAKREYDRKWREKRKAEELENPGLAAERKAHRNARDKIWRANNKERIREYNRKYWEKKALLEIKSDEV